jgi:hypothetical protein
MEPHVVSILVLGDDKCGKSTFLSSVLLYPHIVVITANGLTQYSRISKGANNLSSNAPITLLRDLDQPFIFELRARTSNYRLEFHDTSSPENWRLLRPDLVILCYDISQRLSLLNMQRVVRANPLTFMMPPLTPEPVDKRSPLNLPFRQPPNPSPRAETRPSLGIGSKRYHLPTRGPQCGAGDQGGYVHGVFGCDRRVASGDV